MSVRGGGPRRRARPRHGEHADTGKPAFVGLLSNGTSGDINNVNYAAPAPPKRAPGEQIAAVAQSVADTAFAAYTRLVWQSAAALATAERDLTLAVGPHRLKRLQVQIHRTRANGTAPRQRHDRMTVTRQHRPEDEDRGPHLAHDVIIGGVVGDGMRRHRQNLTVLQAGDLGPQRLQKLGHGADVRQARCIGQCQRFFRQKRRGHQRKTGVLGPRDRDHPVQRTIAFDHDRIHAVCLTRPCLHRHGRPRPDLPWPAPAPCAARHWP